MVPFEHSVDFATTGQLTLIRVLVDCLLNIICQLFIVMLLQQTLLTISNFATTVF